MIPVVNYKETRNIFPTIEGKMPNKANEPSPSFAHKRVSLVEEKTFKGLAMEE